MISKLSAISLLLCLAYAKACAQSANVILVSNVYNGSVTYSLVPTFEPTDNTQYVTGSVGNIAEGPGSSSPAPAYINMTTYMHCTWSGTTLQGAPASITASWQIDGSQSYSYYLRGSTPNTPSGSVSGMTSCTSATSFGDTINQQSTTQSDTYNTDYLGASTANTEYSISWSTTPQDGYFVYDIPIDMATLNCTAQYSAPTYGDTKDNMFSDSVNRIISIYNTVFNN